MSSPASPQGYHTPIDDDEEEGDLPPLTPRGAGSLLQAPTPSSAIMTVSLDGYLEPQRMSFSSPPTSELIPRAPSLDVDSFPVFSPPPYGAVVGHGTTGSSLGGRHQRQSSIGPPWMHPLATPRPSVSLSSPRSHHTCNEILPCIILAPLTLHSVHQLTFVVSLLVHSIVILWLPFMFSGLLVHKCCNIKLPDQTRPIEYCLQVHLVQNPVPH